MSDKSLADLILELQKAKDALGKARQTESFARSETTAATNRYNNLTKEIDAMMAEMKKKAPRDTDWRNEKKRGI